MEKIIYTFTDEAPALATRSLLPIVTAFTSAAGVEVETRDISLAGRIVAAFSDQLPVEHRTADALAELGELTAERHANIIKLPNISASVPQLKAAIAELQADGCPVPDYPESPATPGEQEARSRYDAVKGSAVNPVLREGNSDRRAPAAVKAYARRYPHLMGAWSPDSTTEVATMGSGDFRSNEQSFTVDQASQLSVVFTPSATSSASSSKGSPRELLAVDVAEGTVVDATFMSVGALREFLRTQLDRASSSGRLFSLHLKATMMKVSDPIIFGHCVREYLAGAFSQWGSELAEAGAEPNNGMANVLAAVERLAEPTRSEVQQAIDATLNGPPALAMVDSDRGITNLHVPSDVIIDASMPAMIRSSGQMYDADGQLADTLAVIPDSSYAGVFQAAIDECRTNGAFDPVTMGSVPNVGLMAQKAEEYGSHDRTFELAEPGTVEVRSSAGDVLASHQVEAGDIWRMCTVNQAAVENWIALALERGTVTGAPVVFWLDRERPHDAQLLRQVEPALAEAVRAGSEAAMSTIILSPARAAELSFVRMRSGEDTISATGNVLRDYCTDLFPILELGTSAKMLSVVPLMAGGGLFETGAGGSAPKHVQQFVAENHLRWDSLGEFLALAASLEHLGRVHDNAAADLLATTLDSAVERWLLEGRAPSRKVNEPDNRASHFYLALYWACELASQTADLALGARFKPLADALEANSDQILADLIDCQGDPVDLGGYYCLDAERVDPFMRPSATFNQLIDGFAEAAG